MKWKKTNMSFANRLQDKLKKILYEKRKNSGLLLEDIDVIKIFDIIEKNDIECSLMIQMLKAYIVEEFINGDYLTVEQKIKDILCYYGLYGKLDIIKCRHQLFFKDKKISKKPYFGKNKREKILKDLEIIIKKLESSDEI